MKKNRQSVIARLIEENTISTQEELLQMLLDEGFNVTQATVSRDIKSMRIVKHPDATGEYRYCLPTQNPEENAKKYMTILMGAALQTDIAMNTVVVKCHAGTAMAAAAAFDSLSLDGVAGSLAGDDTIFVLCYSLEEAAKVKEQLDSLLNL